MHKKCLTLLVTIILFFILAQTPVFGQQGAVISGRVIDAQTGSPVQNAVIIIWGPDIKLTLTDSSGFFYAQVEKGGSYSIYAFYDRKETPGVDYVPGQWKTYLERGSQASFVFTLYPGASLFLEGEVRFVESHIPASRFWFTVLSPSGHPLGIGYSLTEFYYEIGGNLEKLVEEYGLEELVRDLGLEELIYARERRLVIVPAETEVVVKVGAAVFSGWALMVWKEFMVDGKVGFFKLAQGTVLSVDVREDCIGFNMARVKESIDSAFSLLREAGDAGFLVTVEQQDLLRALSLVDVSMVALKKGLYDVSFADLRSSYILADETTKRLNDLIRVGSQSALISPFLFVFVALAVAYLILERRTSIDLTAGERRLLSISLNLIIASAIYVALLALFFIVFPGCRLVSPVVFTATVALALFVGQIAVVALPLLLEEKKTERRSIAFRSAVIVAFSIACRNLRRRKRRTTLGLINIMIMIFGFITLTSISPGYGLVSRVSGKPKISMEALFIRDALYMPEAHFAPLPESFITWLENQPNITFMVPKAENLPSMMPLDNLYAPSGNEAWIYGVLGIVPSAEAKITFINNTVIDGHYLRDGEHDGVLISSSLAERLGVGVGDKIYGFKHEFTITGLFDEEAMEKLLDVDGDYLIPRYIHPISRTHTPCGGDKIIVTTFERSLTLPGVAVSRVDLQLKDQRDLLNFAQTVTLIHEYTVYVSFEGTLYWLYVGAYTEEKGLSLVPFLMILVMLSISATMFGAVTERRSEIASLSSVGLNPSCIIALFMAEATIFGFVGGGLGYLLGTSGYRVATAAFMGTLQVREKVSAEWGLLALFLSVITAVLASVIPAMKASTIATPSLLRRWKLGESERPKKLDQPWVIELPVKIKDIEVDPFLGFIQKRLRDFGGDVIEPVEEIKREDEETPDGLVKRLHFKYYTRKELFGGEVVLQTRNELITQRSEGEDYFEAKLFSFPLRGGEKSAHQTATFVRRLIFEWNTLTFNVATPFTPSLSQLYTLVNTYKPTTLYVVATEAGVSKKLEPLEKRLDREGMRVPRLFLYRANPFNMEECMKMAAEIVLRVNVVCVSGGPNSVSTALALAATNQNKMMCYVVDPRSPEEQMADTYKVLKVVDVWPEARK